jgi:MFS family permease
MTFLRVLRRPYCLRVLSGSWLGRLPMAMAAVAIPLTLRHAGADYVFIGAAAGSYAISSAIGAPVIGRIVDRIGQVKVLLPTALIFVAGPLAVSLCVAVAAPIAALWAEAVLTLLGVLVFATARLSRQWRPELGHDRHWPRRC